MGADQSTGFDLATEAGVAHSCGGWLEVGGLADGCEVDLGLLGLGEAGG